jgi:hypothetical protein
MELSPNNNNISNIPLDHITVQKMVFVFNSLNDGWTVRKIEDNKFEFIKDKGRIKKEILLDEFIKTNLDINNLPK